MPWWAWVLLVMGGLCALSCVSCIGFFAWFGANTPDTYIYAGNEVPATYLQTARALGVLDHDEKVQWFYSDDVLGIEDGFYFVSDRRVVVYRAGSTPPQAIAAFDQIAEVDLMRDTSFFADSTITLTLHDGDVIAFPLSSEKDRDVKFFELIIARSPEASSRMR